MNKLVLAIATAAIAGIACGSQEGALPLSRFRLESDGIGESGRVTVEGTQDGKAWIVELKIRAFGRDYVVPAKQLEKLAPLQANGVRVSYERGYDELGGRTLYVQLQLGFTSRTARTALITVVENGRIEVGALQNATDDETADEPLVRAEAVVTGYRPQAMHDNFGAGKHAVYDAVEFRLTAPEEWRDSRLVVHFTPGDAVSPFRREGVRCSFEIERQYLVRPADSKAGKNVTDAPLFEGALVNLTVAGDRIVVTRVSGGPPLMSADGRPVVPSRQVLVDLRGARFEAVRKDVEAATALLGKDRTWWDVGPDASFLSAEITLGTNRYTLNSWFPLERDNPRIAVSENRGLVAVPGPEEKKRIESGNGDRYRTLTGLFEKALARNPRTPAAPPH